MNHAERSVMIARTWIGTPYRHQATCKGAGCDCLGLLRGIWRDLYGAEPEDVPVYSSDWAEPDGREALWHAAERCLHPRPIDQETHGDVLLFRMRDGSIAKHLGLQADTGAMASFIHAYERHGVVESPLSDPWRRRIVARFSFPEEGF
jgi:NlpC/P60 family putative phage cell wall peptidase